MTVIQAIILGIVQGLSEFLPISSSGHIVLANYHLGFDANMSLLVSIATNTGTLFAALVALRKDVWKAITGFFAGLASAQGREQEGWHIALKVIVGSIPTVIIGLALEPYFENLNQPLFVSCGLIVTGLFLWFTPKGGLKETAKDLSYLDAIIAGLAQGAAIIPGISRAGATIVTLLWRGSSTDLAPRMSFLFYLLVSFGVALRGLLDVQAIDMEMLPLLALIVSSFLTGYFAILWLFRILKRGEFKWFAPYLWGIAALTLLRIGLS